MWLVFRVCVNHYEFFLHFGHFLFVIGYCCIKPGVFGIICCGFLRAGREDIFVLVKEESAC